MPPPSAWRAPAAVAQQELLIVFGDQVGQWIRGVAEDEMHVAVDQSGQHGQSAQVDQLDIGRRLAGRADADDLSVVVHHYRPVALNRGTRSIDQPPPRGSPSFLTLSFA